jgi:hypothetical protein
VSIPERDPRGDPDREPGGGTGAARRDPAGPPIVEWFRLDASQRIVRSLALGAGIMLLGSIVSAGALLVSRGALPHPVIGRRRDVSMRDPAIDPHTGRPLGLASGPASVPLSGQSREAHSAPRSPVLELTTGLFAFACLLGGGLTAILGLRRVLSEESYLALRHDGALFVHGDEERFVAWDDVEDVRWDASSDALLFVAHDGETVPLQARFADIANEEIARRARGVRRRAVFGLLRAARPSAAPPSPEEDG